ncbi:MAG: alpha-amylase family glycosyl hydrolase, partial [Ectothiorhodospiraceae bacterium]
MTDQAKWWEGAVIYQIYPSSFYDSNDDGIGDLPGVTRKLDYVASLGVDAVWISPFFLSPMKDFGYDVADYRQVDPRYGTNADFDALLAEAHRRGIRVIIDMVICHTSDQHPWFAESRSSRTNDKAEWYVWSDPRPDGTEPNNWLGFFGGRAWSWDHRRRQYYLCHYLDAQPNLNYYNPEVQEAMLDTCRHWLDRGVDGFRMDAIATLMFDPELRDNPSRSPDDPYLTGSLGGMPFGRQHNYSRQLN